jgi:hypothetical protein
MAIPVAQQSARADQQHKKQSCAAERGERVSYGYLNAVRAPFFKKKPIV